MTSKIIILLGRRGCGKTEYAKHILKSLKRYIILDPIDEYKDGLKIYNFDELSNLIMKYRFNDELRLSYTPSFNEDTQICFQGLCKVIYAMGNITFVVEEIGTFMTATSCAKQFLSLVRLSRHKDINLISITQRATDIPRLLRSQATEIISFQQIEPRDLKYLKEFLNTDTIEKIRHFKNYEYLSYQSDGKITYHKPLNL